MHAGRCARICFALLALLAPSASGEQPPGSAASVQNDSRRTLLPQQSLVPGGVALVRIDAAADDPPRATVNGVASMVLRQRDHWLAVVGIPLGTAPGRLEVAVERRRAGATSVELVIRPKQYAVQQLRVAPGMVELAPDDLARVNRERPLLDAALATFSEAPPATSCCGSPRPVRVRARTACVACSTESRAIRTREWTSRRRRGHPSSRRLPAGRPDGRPFLRRQYGDRRPRAGACHAVRALERHRREAGRRRGDGGHDRPRGLDRPRDRSLTCIGE